MLSAPFLRIFVSWTVRVTFNGLLAQKIVLFYPVFQRRVPMIELGLRWLILGETQPWWIRFVFDAFFTFSRPQTCPKLLRNPMEYTREAPQAVWADFQNLDFSPKIVFVLLGMLLDEPLPGAGRGRDRLWKWLPYVAHRIPERFYPTHRRFHATAPQTAQRNRERVERYPIKCSDLKMVWLWLLDVKRLRREKHRFWCFQKNNFFENIFFDPEKVNSWAILL